MVFIANMLNSSTRISKNDANPAILDVNSAIPLPPDQSQAASPNIPMAAGAIPPTTFFIAATLLVVGELAGTLPLVAFVSLAEARPVPGIVAVGVIGEAFYNRILTSIKVQKREEVNLHVQLDHSSHRRNTPFHQNSRSARWDDNI